MEDFRIELITGWAPGRAPSRCPSSTSRCGGHHADRALGSPFLSRFGIGRDLRLLNSAAELTTIVKRIGAPAGESRRTYAGAEEIGRRARGTPRIANRLLRRVRDFAEVRGDGKVTRTWPSTPCAG